MLNFVGLMASLAVSLLVSMATVGAVAVGVGVVVGGGCWMWLRKRRAKPDIPEQ